MESTMHEAKTNLPKPVPRARAGEEVIPTHGKTRVPMARIVPIDASKASIMKQRPIGLYAGEMGSGRIDLAPMTEVELALWEAPIVSTWTGNSSLSDEPE